MRGDSRLIPRIGRWVLRHNKRMQRARATGKIVVFGSRHRRVSDARYAYAARPIAVPVRQPSDALIQASGHVEVGVRLAPLILRF